MRYFRRSSRFPYRGERGKSHANEFLERARHPPCAAFGPKGKPNSRRRDREKAKGGDPRKRILRKRGRDTPCAAIRPKKKNLRREGATPTLCGRWAKRDTIGGMFAKKRKGQRMQTNYQGERDTHSARPWGRRKTGVSKVHICVIGGVSRRQCLFISLARHPRDERVFGQLLLPLGPIIPIRGPRGRGARGGQRAYQLILYLPLAWVGGDPSNVRRERDFYLCP